MKKRELKISLSILLFLTVITMPLLNFYPNFIHDTDFDHVILKESNSPPPEQIWNKTWGGIDNDFGRDVVLDKTGNIYIVGDSESYEANGRDVCVVKYNSSGDKQWNRTYGGNNDDQGFTIALNKDEQLGYVAGHTKSYTVDGGDLYIVAFNTSTGDMVWNKSYDGGYGQDDDYGHDIILDDAGDIYVAGYLNDGLDDVLWLVKIEGTTTTHDLPFDIKWDHGIGMRDQGFGIALDSSGNIYVSGDTYNILTTSQDLCLIKFNSIGAELWNTTWGGSNDDYGTRMALNGNRAYVTGYTSSFGATSLDVSLAIFDTNTGNIIDNSSHDFNSNDDYGRDIIVDSGGNSFITGNTDVPITTSDVFVVHFNSTGDYQWNVTWNENTYDSGYGITNDDSNIYIAGGTSPSLSDVLLIKYNVTIDTIIQPAITINEIKSSSAINETTPEYNITTSGENLDWYWYQLSAGTIKSHEVVFKDSIPGEKTGHLKQDVWALFGNGTLITITFFVNNTFGSIASDQITVIKISEDLIVPFGNIYLIFMTIGIISVILYRKNKFKIKKS